MRHKVFDLLQTHSLFDGTLHPDKADAILIFQQLTNSANTTVTEMINIIYSATTVFKLNKIANNFKNIIFDSNFYIGAVQIFKHHPVTAKRFNHTTILVKTTLFDCFGKFYSRF